MQKIEARFKIRKEQYQNQIPIGFTVPGVNYFFKYDQKGGWFDQNNRYFNKNGIFQYIQQQWGDQITNQASQKAKNKQQEVLNLDDCIQRAINMIEKYSTDLNNKELRIYFRSKSQRNKIQVDLTKAYSGEQKNKLIRQKSLQMNKQKDLHLKSLPQNCYIDFSIFEQKIYWYGYIKTNQTLLRSDFQNLKKNKNFGILKTKTLYHLQSFQENRYSQKIKKQLQKFTKTKLVKVSINNILQNSPLSLVYDLIQQCSLNQQQYYSITLLNNKAQIITNMIGATKLIQLERYKLYEDKQIFITINQENLQIKNAKFYYVFSQVKFPTTFTTQLLLQNSINAVLKIQINQKYLAIAKQYLKRLLMYRGNDFIIHRISRYL